MVSLMIANALSTEQKSSGFLATVGGDEARRQLRMSVGVVVMLSVGIVSAAVAVGSHPMAARRDVVSVAPITTMHAETHVIGATPI